ncbi:hypothetical protein FI667_g1481, partial [Globisporangium splendens]
MTKAGRRRSVVWECFSDHPTSGKRRVLCRFCSHDTVANPIRMVRHIVKYCPHADDHHKRICREYQSLTVPARRREGNNSASPSMPHTGGSGAGSGKHSHAMLSRGNNDATLEQHYHPLQLPSASCEMIYTASNQLHARLHAGATTPQNAATFPLLQPSNGGAQHSRHSHQHQQNLSFGRQELDQMLTHHSREMSMSSDAAADKAREELVLAILTQDRAAVRCRSGGGGNMPPYGWSLLENDHFKRALQWLKPDFEPPTLHDVRHVHLPKLHAATQADIQTFLKSASLLTIVCSTEIVADHKRNIKWFAVDQDCRCELLGIAANVATEYPEEIAARICQFTRQIPRNATCMLHFCNDSFGAAHVARGLLKKTNPAAGSLANGGSGVVFVGGCMMQQTLLLFRDMLETISCVNLALEKCMEVVSFLRSCKPLQQQLGVQVCVPTPENFHSFIVCVNQLLALKDTLQRVVSGKNDTGMATYLLNPTANNNTSSSRERAFMDAVGDDMFWMCLAFTQEVMRPFAYLTVLSDMGHATSAQLLLCWLMLQNTINFSSMVLEIDKDNFNMMLVDRIRMFSEDHVFACLIFDPRIHGLSLSAHGKRKARLIIADLGTKLNPSINRVQLVEQLLKYLNRERPFDDDESWTMMASMPRLFWMEYLADTPELASVALAVLGFHSHLMPLEETWWTCTQRHRRTSSRNDSSSSKSGVLSVEVEQVRFHYSKTQSSSSAESARKQSLVKYRKCLIATGGGGAAAAGRDLLEELFADDDCSMISSLHCALSEGITDEDKTNRAFRGAEIRSNSSQQLHSTSNSIHGLDCASVALRQFKYWLQRLDEHEKNLPVDEVDADGSLQRFDAEWLELSVETAQQIRACADKFVLDYSSSNEYATNASSVAAGATGSGSDPLFATAASSTGTDERGATPENEDEDEDGDRRHEHEVQDRFDHEDPSHGHHHECEEDDGDDHFSVHEGAASDAIGV